MKITEKMLDKNQQKFTHTKLWWSFSEGYQAEVKPA